MKLAKILNLVLLGNALTFTITAAEPSPRGLRIYRARSRDKSVIPRLLDSSLPLIGQEGLERQPSDPRAEFHWALDTRAGFLMLALAPKRFILSLIKRPFAPARSPNSATWQRI